MAVDGEDLNIDCGLGQKGERIMFHMAIVFSLKTATTVGYDIPNGLNMSLCL